MEEKVDMTTENRQSDTEEGEVLSNKGDISDTDNTDIRPPTRTKETFTNGSFTDMWIEQFQASQGIVCTGETNCRVYEHRKMGHFMENHSPFSARKLFSFLWTLTLCITTPVQGMRVCNPCKGLNKIITGSMIFMLKHIKGAHGELLGLQNKARQICSNLRVLKWSNTAFRFTCPMQECNETCADEIEMYLHFTITHKTWPTKYMITCPFCLCPLLNKSIDQHARCKGREHNKCECGLTFVTIGEMLNHMISTNPITVFEKLKPNLRNRLLTAIYTGQMTTMWAKSAPLLPLTDVKYINSSLPDIMTVTFMSPLFCTTARQIVDTIYENSNEIASAMKMLDENKSLSNTQLKTIHNEIEEEYFLRKISDILKTQREAQGTQWMREITGLCIELRIKNRMTKCNICMDSDPHTENQDGCFDRSNTRPLGPVYIHMQIDRLLPTEQGILIVSGKSLFNMGPIGGIQNLSSMQAIEKYPTVYTVRGKQIKNRQGDYTSVEHNYFKQVCKILDIAKPNRTTPVILEYFSMIAETAIGPVTIKEIFLEIGAFLHEVQNIREGRNTNIWILLPLTPWCPPMTKYEYLRKATIVRDAGALMAKMAGKLKIPVIPTVGIIEAQPLIMDTYRSSEYLVAALSEGDKVEPTRNLDGTPTRHFYKRFCKLMGLVQEAVHHANMMEDTWKERKRVERKSKEARLRKKKDPTYMTVCFPTSNLEEEDESSSEEY